MRHQCSNSCKPAFRYSPLLNEQHSRRSNRLPNHKFGTLMSGFKLNSIPFWNFSCIGWSWNSTHLLRSCTLMNEKTWLKIFFVIIGGTWRSQKSDESAKLEKPEKELVEEWIMLTWFPDIKPKVWSSLLTMLCQCMFDACCFATIFEWILLDDPLIDLTRDDLGACLW